MTQVGRCQIFEYAHHCTVLCKGRGGVSHPPLSCCPPWGLGLCTADVSRLQPLGHSRNAESACFWYALQAYKLCIKMIARLLMQHALGGGGSNRSSMPHQHNAHPGSFLRFQAFFL